MLKLTDMDSCGRLVGLLGEVNVVLAHASLPYCAAAQLVLLVDINQSDWSTIIIYLDHSGVATEDFSCLQPKPSCSGCMASWQRRAITKTRW
ncbi:MAG: hypothetical protein KGL96_13210, partial [Hyphomicrobiales bacterium]|nr:hypothetical protein [Hyphomicrobiales bacterium]